MENNTNPTTLVYEILSNTFPFGKHYKFDDILITDLSVDELLKFESENNWTFNIISNAEVSTNIQLLLSLLICIKNKNIGKFEIRYGEQLFPINIDIDNYLIEFEEFHKQFLKDLNKIDKGFQIPDINFHNICEGKYISVSFNLTEFEYKQLGLTDNNIIHILFRKNFHYLLFELIQDKIDIKNLNLINNIKSKY